MMLTMSTVTPVALRAGCRLIPLLILVAAFALPAGRGAAAPRIHMCCTPSCQDREKREGERERERERERKRGGSEG